MRRRRWYGAAGVAIALLVAGWTGQPPAHRQVTAVRLHGTWLPPLLGRFVPSLLTVPVAVPRGSAPTLASAPSEAFGTPMAGPLEVGQLQEVVPLPTGVLPLWFTQHMARLGYRQAGSGMTSTAGGPVVHFLMFAPRSAETTLSITVAWVPAGPRRSVAAYWVTEVLLPTRPAKARLPSDVVRVVARWQGRTARPVPPRVITSRPWIQRLVDGLNQLPPPPDGITSCLAVPEVQLTLTTASGQHSTVLTGGCGLTVNGVSLWDATGAVTEQINGLFPQQSHTTSQASTPP